MTSGQANIVIGAGPCGLAAAHTLERSGAGVTVLEKEGYAGGLAASFRDAAGFVWDQGGHVVFSHYGEFDALVERLMGSEVERHERVSYILTGDRRVPYPFQRNLASLSPPDALECVLGLIDRPRQDRDDFAAWMLAHFGEGITRHFMLPYNTKVWSTPPRDMSTEWLGERVATVDWRTSLTNLVLGRDDPGWGPNNTFVYPATGGTGEPFRRLAASLRDVRHGTSVVRVDPDTRRLTTAAGEEMRFDHLVSTIPLTHLVRALTRCPREVRTAAAALRHNQVRVVGIGAEGASAPDWNWMYFPDPDYPFYRVTNLGGYARGNLPAAGGPHHSLMSEISAPAHQDLSAVDSVEPTLAGLRRAGLLDDGARVLSVHTRDIPMAYPIPTLGRTEAVATILDFLDSRGIYSRGRFGTWLYEYGNMDHAVKMGIDVALRLTDGTPETIPLPHLRAAVLSAADEGR
ncbi:protoporphyrinogen/coproporphyrinogen oxidase [Streptomyces sp. URMC 123]|uniref:protoporphyrinogen/coproporphyrinogen oxidase n=1 Tax=Streptomyces sp. URMC 123 TaxID=3423403 RepID=UPI003F1A2480